MALWRKKREKAEVSRDRSPTDERIVDSGELKRNDNSFSNDDEKLGRFASFMAMFSLPYDWYLSINEEIAVIDWDNKSSTVAWPLGNILTFLFFIIRLLQDNVIAPNLNKLNHSDDAFDFSKSKNLQKYDYFHQYQESGSTGENLYYKMLRQLHRLFYVLTLVLLITNITIAYRYLFAHFQTYSIFYWKTIPRSKNVTKKSLHDLNHTYVEDAQRDSLWGMIKYLLFNKSSDDDVSNNSHYYELRKWAPSKFLTALFISFSPVAFAFLWMTDVSFKTLIPIIIHQYVLWFTIVERYEQKLKNDQILSMSNIAELNSKVIQPKMNVLKQDAMVDATPYNDGIVYFYPAYTTTRSHVFLTHTLDGKLLKEKYNPSTDSFEDTRSRRTENYVRFSHYHPKTINEAYARDSYRSRQHSPRLSPSRYAQSYGGNTPSAPSTPLLIPSQQPHFDHSMLANASRSQNAGGIISARRNSQSPIKQHFTNRLLNFEDDSTYSMGDVSDDRYRLDERFRRGRPGFLNRSPDAHAGTLHNEDNGNNNSASRSPLRNSSSSPFR
ncbi:unnamed protein product [Kluyveromyces dobzhanskii CBS 2104]|uniref:Nuclear rim protein 1 n=1 Tax=Kluyveromyces dobzhanskii CBS 2104 TaxID=1427455 RepID=A0A0A8L9A0_9SACH|nr:unnamed protein product [Kluyveromyces dobzhanskii CBS 2104]